MDRRYSSPILFKYLLASDIYAVGTVMKNRINLPPEFRQDTRLQKGQRIARVANDILATRWRDKRDVHILSTINSDTLVDTDGGRQHLGEHETLKPEFDVSYNANKAGVDKLDQAASYYPLARKVVEEAVLSIVLFGSDSCSQILQHLQPQKTQVSDIIFGSCWSWLGR